MKISVIIPVYNAEKYLNKCLDSVLGQTYDDIEIVAINDGSKDKSLDILNDYSKKYKNIKIFEGPKNGAGAARNVGIDNATGDYIMFLDSDDYIDKNMIKKLYNSIIDNGSDLSICGFYREEEITGKIISEEMTKSTIKDFEVKEKNILDLAFIFPAPWGKLIKRDIIEENRFVLNRETAGEDLVFFLNYIPNVKKISFVNEPLLHYIVRPGSLTSEIGHNHVVGLQNEFLNLKNKYSKMQLSTYYYSLLDLSVFIHVGISLPHRLAEQKSRNLKKEINEIRNYMNINFPNWKRANTNKKGLQNLGLNLSKLMYRLGFFSIFIKIYNFMINNLKLNMKW